MKKKLPLFIQSAVIYCAMIGCSSKESIVPVCKLATITHDGIVETYSYTANNLTSIDAAWGNNMSSDLFAYDSKGRLTEV
jgi:hypothetical protein